MTAYGLDGPGIESAKICHCSGEGQESCIVNFCLVYNRRQNDSPSVCRQFVQLRGVTKITNVVSASASVKMSLAEKLAHGVLIACGVCTYSM